MKKTDIEKLQEEIKQLKMRNKQVESNKTWETSKTRQFTIAILTYLVMVIFMISLQFDRPFIGAIIPSLSYLLSMCTMGFMRQWWTKKINKKGFMQLGAMFSVMITFPFASTIFIKQQTAHYIHSSVDSLPHMESALILGAAAYGNRLSTVLMHRMDAGIHLYKNQKVNTLIVSGAPNETMAMKRYAIDNGVPESDIIEDSEGLSTLASVNNFKKHPSITFVTQAFHLPRTIYMAKQLNLKSVGYIADKGSYTKISQFKKRELLANSYAILVTAGGNRK